MGIKQISISMDNVSGKLLDLSQLLGTEGINIRAISVTESQDISIIRFVADNPEKTVNVLRSQGYSVKETDVIAVEIPDHPGGLRAVLRPLKRASINVLNLYPYLGRGKSGQAIVIVDTNKNDEAVEVLKKDWVHIFGKEIYTL